MQLPKDFSGSGDTRLTGSPQLVHTRLCAQHESGWRRREVHMYRLVHVRNELAYRGLRESPHWLGNTRAASLQALLRSHHTTILHSTISLPYTLHIPHTSIPAPCSPADTQNGRPLRCSTQNGYRPRSPAHIMENSRPLRCSAQNGRPLRCSAQDGYRPRSLAHIMENSRPLRCSAQDGRPPRCSALKMATDLRPLAQTK